MLALLFGDEEPVTWKGRHFTLDEAYCRPRPAQTPRPPLWVGGKGGPRLLRLVARPATAGTRCGHGRRRTTRSGPGPWTRRAKGRAGPRSVRRSIGLYTVVGEDRGRPRIAGGSAWPGRPRRARRLDPENGAGTSWWARQRRSLERIEAFARLGVEEVILSIGTLPFAVPTRRWWICRRAVSAGGPGAGVNELEAAVRVLREEGKPLHWTVIQDLALRRGYLDPFTQPDIRRRLLAALSAAARSDDGPVVRAERGVYRIR